MKDNLLAQPLKVGGFGACMINGYPHNDGGLFNTACQRIEKSLFRPVQSMLVSLGGFTAPRAQKFLRGKLFRFNPDYIVLQLAATDAQCPIRAVNRRIARGLQPRSSIGSKPNSVSKGAAFMPASSLSYLRWELASLIGYLEKIESITPLCLYISAIEHMVEECRSAGIKPVVLSPFIYGSRYTMGKAYTYTDALRQLHLKAPGMIFVDCVQLLSSFPKSLVLQHDGFHLSKKAHMMVGEAVGNAIVADVTAATSDSG